MAAARILTVLPYWIKYLAVDFERHERETIDGDISQW
jgi:hypothetical protein